MSEDFRIAEERMREMVVQCTWCGQRFREINQNTAPRTVNELLQQESTAPDPEAILVHGDESHEEEIKLIALRLGLPYVGGR